MPTARALAHARGLLRSRKRAAGGVYTESNAISSSLSISLSLSLYIYIYIRISLSIYIYIHTYKYIYIYICITFVCISITSTYACVCILLYALQHAKARACRSLSPELAFAVSERRNAQVGLPLHSRDGRDDAHVVF